MRTLGTLSVAFSAQRAAALRQLSSWQQQGRCPQQDRVPPGVGWKVKPSSGWSLLDYRMKSAHVVRVFATIFPVKT